MTHEVDRYRFPFLSDRIQRVDSPCCWLSFTNHMKPGGGSLWGYGLYHMEEKSGIGDSDSTVIPHLSVMVWDSRKGDYCVCELSPGYGIPLDRVIPSYYVFRRWYWSDMHEYTRRVDNIPDREQFEDYFRDYPTLPEEHDHCRCVTWEEVPLPFRHFLMWVVDEVIGLDPFSVVRGEWERRLEPKTGKNGNQGGD